MTKTSYNFVRLRYPLLLAGLVALLSSALLIAHYLEDFNRDGNIDSSDVAALLFAAMDDPGDPDVDYDGDGSFSIRDALAMMINIKRGKLTEVAPEPGDVIHREPAEGEIPVTGPGNYGQEGATYILTCDVSSPTSAIFLGNNVTLDLNGYTLSYADTTYDRVLNYSFEENLDGWDVSGAPGAKVENTATRQTFIGEKLLYLPSGQEIVSSYVTLPVANRSYYAVCGVSSSDMKITINVEDEQGNPLSCTYVVDGSVKTTLPELSRSPCYGGGFVFAVLRDVPAGRYRIRVKAEKGNCLIDYVDLLPALDVGVGIVERTYPWARYENMINFDYTAFFDYTVPGTRSEPLSGIPVVSGPGTVTIRNGTIRSGRRGVRSWGVQSTANDVMVVLDNVRFDATGINANAVDVPQAQISNCRFEIDAPFIIDRHHTDDQPVNLRGSKPSEVYDCEFIGGQGCLTLNGANSRVYRNLFVNRQMVTNHYSINVSGEGSEIFDNEILPDTGSGILVGASDGIEIHDNLIRVTASAPTCEYGFTTYSVNAIRVTDYNAAAGSESAAANNRIYNNEIYVTGRDYPQRSSYIPSAYGVFLSTGGGTNHFYDNTFSVNHEDPSSKALAAAFYVGGSDNGGHWSGNTVTSNVPAIWIGTSYGPAANAVFSRNTFIRAEDAPDELVPVLMGFWTYTATDVEFRSNILPDMPFVVDVTEEAHTYKVFWTLGIQWQDQDGQPVAGEEVVIADKNGAATDTLTSDNQGQEQIELLEYEYADSYSKYNSPYTVTAGGLTETVTLDKNSEIVFEIAN